MTLIFSWSNLVLKWAECHCKGLHHTEWMLHVHRELGVVNFAKLQANRVWVQFTVEAKVLSAGLLDVAANDTLGITQCFVASDARRVLLSDLRIQVLHICRTHVERDFASFKIVLIHLVFKPDFLFLMIVIDPRFNSLLLINYLRSEKLNMSVNLLAFALIWIQNGTELTSNSLTLSQFLACFHIFWINTRIENVEDFAAIVTS